MDSIINECHLVDGWCCFRCIFFMLLSKKEISNKSRARDEIGNGNMRVIDWLPFAFGLYLTRKTRYDNESYSKK